MRTHIRLNRYLFNLSLVSLVVVASLALLFYGPQRAGVAARPARAERGADSNQMTSIANALNADGTLKLGAGMQGSFSTAGYRMVLGPHGAPSFVQGGVPTECARWSDQFPLNNGLNGTVYALAVSGNSVYVGGQFTVVGGVSANNVARWDTLGQFWEPLFGQNGGNGVSSNGVVAALAVNGNDVFVGGSFTQANIGPPAGQVPASNVARWNSSTHTWSALTGAGGNGVIGPPGPPVVKALAVMSGGKVIVGGSFFQANVGGVPVFASNVAMWDGSNWSALTGPGGISEGVGVGAVNTVNALVVSNNDVFVGGSFTFVNSGVVIANNVAKWNTSNTWSALTGPGGEGVNGPVNALALSGSGDVYVGGNFTQAIVGAPINANNVAKWNSGAWSALNGAGGQGVNNEVRSLILNGGDVYVGGLFSQANVGAPISARAVAKWNGGGWSALTGTGGGNGVDGLVFALAPVGSEVFVGGQFTQANVGGTVIPAYSLAKFGSGAWSAINQIDGANGVLGASVLALAVSGNDVYVGGSFQAVGNVVAYNVAKWNGLTNTWSALTGPGGGNGVNGEIRAIAVSGTRVYVGGVFGNVNFHGTPVSASFVAYWNSGNSTWSALTGQGNGEGTFGPVNALAVSADNVNVYVGGQFPGVNNPPGPPVPANNVACWNSNTNTWSALTGQGGQGVDNTVNALAASVNDVYVGGSFTFAATGGGFVPANRVAKWNSSSGWSALGTAGGNGLSGPAFALALSGNFLYVGGNFTTANVGGGPQVPANRVARLNTSNNTWSALPGANNGNGVSSQVFALAVSGNDVYVGGVFNFANTGGTTVQAFEVAKWNAATNTWSNLPDVGGTPGIQGLQVLALGVVGDSLYAGGIFDKAGEMSSVNFAKYCPNSPPLITPVGVTRAQGAPVSNSQIATVTDQEDPLNSLVVTVNGNTSATSNGVTISNISVSAAGVVTANVVAAAGAKTTTFTLTVRDASLFRSTQLTVTVVGLNLVLSDPAVCLSPGGLVGVAAQVTNTNATAQPFTFTATLPPQLLALPNSCIVNTGTCTVVSNSSVTWTGTLNSNQSVAIQYQAQVADNTPPASTLCVNSTSGIVGGVAATVQACTTVNCPPAGPGLIFPVTSEVSDQKAGSVLVYNLYSSNAAAPNAQNTRISITNTHTRLPIAVHLFFVDGETCSVADAFVCLTANQKASFLASDLDPGTTGYLVAVAADVITGCPVNFNYLIGSAHVKLSSGHEGSLGAEAFSRVAGGSPICDANSVTALLSFDGVSYNQAPRVLALDDIPSRADGNDTLLVLNRLGGNLATQAQTLSGIFGILYDDAENPLSFNFSPGTCQFRSSLSGNFPRTAPRIEQFIPAGRSGWAKFYSQNDQALLGAAFNFNPNRATTTGAFNQGRNLHKLTLTTAATLTIPIFPPNC